MPLPFGCGSFPGLRFGLDEKISVDVVLIFYGVWVFYQGHLYSALGNSPLSLLLFWRRLALEAAIVTAACAAAILGYEPGP